MLSIADITNRYKLTLSNLRTMAKHHMINSVKIKNKWYFCEVQLEYWYAKFLKNQLLVEGTTSVKSPMRIIQHLLAKGYPVWGAHKINVLIEDLPHATSFKVTVLCSRCGSAVEGLQGGTAVTIMHKNNGKYLCYSCAHSKSDEFIINSYHAKGCTLVSPLSDYVNYHSNLEYRCNTHPTVAFSTSFRYFQRNKYPCPICRKLNTSGSNSRLFVHGHSSIKKLLRGAITQWRQDSLQAANYRCAITGARRDLHVHHLTKSYDELFYDTFYTLDIPIKSDVSLYTPSELWELSSTILDKHYQSGLGVVLSGRVHEEFHAQTTTSSREGIDAFTRFATEYQASEV